MRDFSFPPREREGWRLHEPPVAQEDNDEVDLRRRRREAVVIHDGDAERPVGEEDVYMRGEEEGDMDERALWESIAELRENDRALQAELEELLDVRGLRTERERSW